ncbi:hypothetical protein COO60DRAFT_1473417, partial [Scenedesmus sp. NREL 46B-D3]
MAAYLNRHAVTPLLLCFVCYTWGPVNSGLLHRRIIPARKSAASLTPSNMTIAAAVLSGLLQRHSMALASRHVSARHDWH